jgi:hypothetical protein
MKTNDIHRHCPEVENLMEGKMPFITRYGIIIVVFVLLAIITILLLSEGTSHQLIKEMIEHTIKQMTTNNITNIL